MSTTTRVKQPERVGPDRCVISEATMTSLNLDTALAWGHFDQYGANSPAQQTVTTAHVAF